MAVLGEQELEAALMAYCKSVGGGGGGGGGSEESFSKGIGGSKEDHIAEKVAGEVLRSAGSQPSDEEDKESNTSLFERWIYGTSAAAKEVLKGKKVPQVRDYAEGKWIRTLNSQGTCYLYIHTSTYQMQGTRPDDYVDDGKQEEAADPYENFPSCHQDNLGEEVRDLLTSSQFPSSRRGLLMAMYETFCCRSQNCGSPAKFPSSLAAATKGTRA
eukprot:125531-Hanusia_phi.AAC.6